MASSNREHRSAVSVACPSQLSTNLLGERKYTGRISQGDGDLDGNEGGHCCESEGFNRRDTGSSGGLLVTRPSSES